MRPSNKFAMAVLSLFAAKSVKNFFDRYDILIFDKKDIEEARQEQEWGAMDLRGNPTHECVCGSQVFYIKAAFQDYEIATYFLDMQCAECGNLATAPTPVDREARE